jgi:hypothetical protein
VLPGGQLELTDSLNGQQGRLDTVLGHFDPAYTRLRGMDDNGGLNGASALMDLPLERNGSVYVRVSGAGDAQLRGSHATSGAYRIYFDLFDPLDPLHEITRIACPNSMGQGRNGCQQSDSLFPTEVDNHWLNPDAARVGMHVNVWIDNLVGPGGGDARDFWLFTDLAANQPYRAQIVSSSFGALVRQFDDQGQVVPPMGGGSASLDGIVPSSGRLRLGITGSDDPLFKGEHMQTGQYTLRVTVSSTVPEPSSLVLMIVGATALVARWRRR